MNPGLNFRFSRACNLPPATTLSQIHRVQALPSNFLKIHFNIIYPSKPVFSKWCLSLRFPHRSHVFTCPLPHTCHKPRPSHLSWLDQTKNILWAVQIIKLLLMRFSPLPSTKLSKDLSYFPSSIWQTKFFPYKKNWQNRNPSRSLYFGTENWNIKDFILNDSTSTNIITAIKTREMRFAGYVALMGQIKKYT